jgi:hypothetical protein
MPCRWMRSLPRRPGCPNSRYARYNVAGGVFPVGLSSLRLLAMDVLSQARRLGGLHRASPVPFRASYLTSGLHPPDATAQRLAAYWYRRWDFPSIPSPRFVAHAVLTLRLRSRQQDRAPTRYGSIYTAYLATIEPDEVSTIMEERAMFIRYLITKRKTGSLLAGLAVAVMLLCHGAAVSAQDRC